MKQMLVLSLLVAMTLLSGAAWAHDRHHRVFVGCCVFIAPVHTFFIRHGFIHPQPFVHEGFVHLRNGATVVVVDPAPQPVWVPGFWWWEGFQWVWAPGHWAWAR